MARSVNGASTPIAGIRSRFGSERDIAGPTVALDEVTGSGAAWEPRTSGTVDETAAGGAGGLSSTGVPKEL